MNEADVARLGLQAGEFVDLMTAIDDGRQRVVTGLRVVLYDIPAGCLAAYYPETNGLVPLDHHAIGARTPASKSIPVRLRPSADIPVALASNDPVAGQERDR